MRLTVLAVMMLALAVSPLLGQTTITNQDLFNIQGLKVAGEVSSYTGLRLGEEFEKMLLQLWVQEYGGIWTEEWASADLICVWQFDCQRGSEKTADLILGSLSRRAGFRLNKERWIVRATLSLYEPVKDEGERSYRIQLGEQKVGPLYGVGRGTDLDWEGLLSRYGWIRSLGGSYRARSGYESAQYDALIKSMKHLRRVTLADL